MQPQRQRNSAAGGVVRGAVGREVELHRAAAAVGIADPTEMRLLVLEEGFALLLRLALVRVVVDDR